MKRSAGLLLYRPTPAGIEVLLVHPGGPFWAGKDDGAWTIPKGEIEDGEDPLAAAKRELSEETGFQIDGEAIPLDPVRQPSGKVIHAWVVRADVDPAKLESNTFSIEWPPKSGRYRDFPEVDRAAWFPIPDAEQKILQGQTPFLAQLAKVVR